MQRERLLIVGNGMAGIRLVENVLAQAPGRYAITVIGSEPHPAYSRLMLSPVLAGEKPFEATITHDRGWYAANDITLHTGRRIATIDRAARELVDEDGARLAYDRLVLATGSRPVILPVAGSTLPGVVGFRDQADVETMLAEARPGRRAIVIGGGLLGLEAANGLAARGMHVTLVHLMPHLMERQLDAAAAHLLRKEFEARGVDIITRAETTAVLGAGRATGIRLADGREIAADLVVMAAGIRPEAELARAAGLAVNRGVIVDDSMRTSDRAIFAVGECAEHAGICHGLVAPLYEMAAVLADSLADKTATYRPAPVATRLKVSGVDLFSAGDFTGDETCEDVVLSDPARGTYRRVVIRADRLVGAVLYGDTADSGFFFDLIASSENIAAMRDALIFGPAVGAAA